MYCRPSDRQRLCHHRPLHRPSAENSRWHSSVIARWTAHASATQKQRAFARSAWEARRGRCLHFPTGSVGSRQKIFSKTGGGAPLRCVFTPDCPCARGNDVSLSHSVCSSSSYWHRSAPLFADDGICRTGVPKLLRLSVLGYLLHYSFSLIGHRVAAVAAQRSSKKADSID